MLASALNSAWMWKSAGELRAFRRITSNIAETQWQVLRTTLQQNQDTCFGRQHGFAAINSVADYQLRVPLRTYEDHRPFIDRIAQGELNVLTRDRVDLLEPTSGSTGGEKLIPYTQSLRRQFQRGVAAWIADLLSKRPAARTGRAYWSISPIFGGGRRTAGGIPIGFDEDANYLGRFEQLALRRLLVAPPAAARTADLQAFRYCTLLSLLAARDLSLISVWSPTFLTALISPLLDWCERLCHDIRAGTFNPPVAVDPRIVAAVRNQMRPSPRRADELVAIFASTAGTREQLAAAWPQLALISCWTNASAALALTELRTTFPHVEVQPKGLLATEGFVSLPLFGYEGGALAARSHFFEFEEVVPQESAHCAVRLAHELEPGGHYRVTLTTAGGLYRYQLRDEIQVVGFLNQCPLLRFVGKADCVSDRVGEKLSELHVRTVVESILHARRLAARFTLLVPVDDTPVRYRLYIQPTEAFGNTLDLERLQQDLEIGLGENPHYRYAVALGQLAPAEVRMLDPLLCSAWQAFEQLSIERRQKIGDFKPVALDARPGWTELLQAWELPLATASGNKHG